MINRYPLWKYIMLILALIAGLLYALPNLYGEDPAVQIVGIRGEIASLSALAKTQSILKKQHITIKSIDITNKTILIRFFNLDTQLRAFEALIHALGKNYIIALNLAPATPYWLSMIGARPMKLGLDLRGGIHFLIEVNMNIACNKLQEQAIDALRADLRGKNISYVTIRKIENYGSEVRFRNVNIRDQAISWLTSRHRNLVINKCGENALCAMLTNEHLQKAYEHIIQKNMIILRNRVNQLGIAAPVVQRWGTHRIAIELPGIQDVAYAKEILGATTTLEFHLVNNLIDKTISSNVYIPENSEIKITREGYPIVLYKKVILTGDHITDSTYSIDEYNRPQVDVSLDNKGGVIMSTFTKNNIGKLMATLLVEYKDSGKKDNNGSPLLERHEEIVNIATIQSRLGHNFRITGINNHKEARQLSLLLRSGALIAPIQIIEERTIGPALGLKNITQGLEACLYGLVTSVFFMILWYRKFGFIAIIALITNLVLITGIMSLLPGATLTMPGIAGIVLTLAVAVDANVLIYERIKEELGNNRTIQQAIYDGYRGVFSSIVDANITTLITSVILYTIGTGSIKGFAITTAIGTITSMFTAIVGTRAIVNLLYGGKNINKLSI